ncbi:MAG: helix-turn-helix domain-containing protein [Halodesulfurarchaeum sp.]
MSQETNETGNRPDPDGRTPIARTELEEAVSDVITEDVPPSITEKRNVILSGVSNLEQGVALEQRNIQLTVEIEPPDECPLKDVETDVSKVLVDREGDTCRCDVAVTVDLGGRQGTLVAQLTSSGLERCASHVFEEFNCVPDIVDVNDSRLVVRTYVDENLDINALLDALKEVCAYVRLKRVTSDLNASVTQAVIDVDISNITDKQREALEFAIREGYYARPRQVSLQEMAAEFAISEQALAQRLARAEETVMGQLFV